MGRPVPVMPEVLVAPTSDAAALRAAESFVRRAGECIQRQGRFAAALTGGSAPEGVFRRLAEEPLRSAVDWSRVHVFWGDERCVPPEHPRSNYGMAERLLLRYVRIPAENVHRMPGELPPPEGAARYADELDRFFRGDPRFDLLHLGVGPDGHTCSLFPFAETLHERGRTVTPALHGELGEWRITLTYPVVNGSSAVEVLAFGASKAWAVRRALRGPLDPLRIPIQGVRPLQATAEWWLDVAAATEL